MSNDDLVSLLRKAADEIHALQIDLEGMRLEPDMRCDHLWSSPIVQCKKCGGRETRYSTPPTCDSCGEPLTCAPCSRPLHPEEAI